MKILDDIQSVFKSPDFLDDFRRRIDQVDGILSNLFNHEERARITPQGWFLSIVMKHIQKKLKRCQVFLSPTLILPENREVKKALQQKREIIKQYLCGPTYADSNPCRRRKHCMEGALKNTEFDALVVADGQICVLEFEDTWEGICHSLAMAYRVMSYGSRNRLAWVFVAPIRSKEAEKKLERYTEGAKLLFNNAISIENWRIIGLDRRH